MDPRWTRQPKTQCSTAAAPGQVEPEKCGSRQMAPNEGQMKLLNGPPGVSVRLPICEVFSSLCKVLHSWAWAVLACALCDNTHLHTNPLPAQFLLKDQGLETVLVAHPC